MGKYQLLPPLDDADYTALKRDIAERGVIIAVEYDESGEIIDGFHRVKICDELGIKDFPKNVRPYPDEAAKRSQARRLNILRRHLDAKTRRELIEDELAENPNQSDRQVAAGLGVSDKTVAKTRRKSEGCAEIPHVTTRKDTKGRIQPASKPKSKSKPRSGAVVTELSSLAWSGATVSQRTKFLDAIGIKTVWAAMTPAMKDSIREIVDFELRKAVEKSDQDHDLGTLDDLSIPEFLRRKKTDA